jgi:hypothetical protein
MADPIGAGPNSPYDPINGDYTSYKPLAKTAWAKDGSDEHGLTFADVLDAINPLQHLPIISHIYRAITGDKIGLAAKLVGDTLYGGPIGLLASGVTAALEGGAGKTTGEMIAEVANDIFGSSPDDDAGGTPAAAAQEARARDSERAHEDDLAAAMAQMALAPAPPVAAPQLAALAPDAGIAAVKPTAAPASAAPVAAKATAASHAIAAAKDGGDETTQRINKSIAEARRAQAGLLLASLQQADADPAARPLRSESEDARPADGDARPAVDAKPAANPYLPPDRPAAVTNWSNESLAETIARYERAVAANRR